jgi:hypothetical protein
MYKTICFGCTIVAAVVALPLVLARQWSVRNKGGRSASGKDKTLPLLLLCEVVVVVVVVAVQNRWYLGSLLSMNL